MKLIDKAAVLAEIEKVISGLRRNYNPNPLGNMHECVAAAEIEALNLIKDSLNTLEVKDVDFEAAVVAEIEKLISGLRRNCNPNPLGNRQELLAAVEIEALNLIKDSLDTPKVKEVDFEKEIQDHIRE